MRALLTAFLFALAACAPEPAADAVWTLAPAESRVAFVSVKAGQVVEIHHFKELNGEIDEEGRARFEIALDSVETHIEERNDRMRQFLFETAAFPTAVISAHLNLAEFETLAVGERRATELEAVLGLHGAEVPFVADIHVTRVGENRVAVETREPFLLYTDDFGLAVGVEKLRELASLPSIAPNATVVFSIMLER